MACVVDATAPPGASLAREPPTMRVNPMTRTPTPRYAPGRRPRAYHQTHARSVGPPCGLESPRAYHQTHARSVGPTRESAGPRARRGTQTASALGAVSHATQLGELSTVSANVAIPTIWLRGATQCRGIACDIRGKLTQRESCATTHSTAGSAASDVPAAWHGGYRRRKQPAQAHGDGTRDHTQARDDTTTSNTGFPALTSRKVATNQHVFPILHVGSHHLQHRLSHATKPKSHHKPTRFIL